MARKGRAMLRPIRRLNTNPTATAITEKVIMVATVVAALLFNSISASPIRATPAFANSSASFSIWWMAFLYSPTAWLPS